MEQLLLNRNVYVCQTEDGAVFMDLGTENYVGIGREEACTLSTRIRDWPAFDDHPASCEVDANTVVESLRRRGLLTNSHSSGKSPEFLTIQVTDAIPFRGTIANPPNVSLRDVLNFLYACTQAALALKLRPLSRTVAAVRARNGGKSPDRSSADIARVFDLVRVFRRLTPFVFTAMGACLFDSLALIEFLARYDVHATWVLGLRTRPFGAHSWAQYGNLLLNDQLERVEEFTPILEV